MASSAAACYVNEASIGALSENFLIIMLCLLVGNIPFEATEAELREKFEQAGPIVSFR